MQRGVAVGVAFVAHFYGKLFFDGQIEEGAGGVPCAGDRFVGNSVACDGEEAGLAADFVDATAEGLFFGWRCGGECGKIEDRKVRHPETLCQRGVRVNMTVGLAKLDETGFRDTIFVRYNAVRYEWAYGRSR